MAKIQALFILCMVNYCLGSGGAAAGGGGDAAVTSAEVPENVRVITVSKKVEFSCNNTKDENGQPVYKIDWKHDGESLSTDDRVSVFENGTVVISPVEETDIGNYSCQYRDPNANAANGKMYTLIILSYKKLPKSGVAIEGENFSLTCEVEGLPEPALTWKKNNVTVEEAIDATRYNLTQKDEKWPKGSSLTIFGIKYEDAGKYQCCFSNFQGFEVCTETNVRVKDIYAALWPFLGIVIEVVILCLIIFIYEKRRTKNDFEESDTDQGTNSCRKEGPN